MFLSTLYYCFCAALLGGWLIWMIMRPEQWNRWIDRENAFWQRQSWMPPQWILSCERLEKGPLPRLILAGGCAMFLILAAQSIARWPSQSDSEPTWSPCPENLREPAPPPPIPPHPSLI